MGVYLCHVTIRVCHVTIDVEGGHLRIIKYLPLIL